jgi:dihydropteroate synthase
MKYHEAANYLFDLRRHSPRTGVEQTRRLLGHLDDPQLDLTCVQIAGSNGKGSTGRMVERVLREAGLDVGLYTSPHLDDLRERIRVDGVTMRKRAVCEFVEAVDDYVTARAAENESPTFFETVTAMALWEFARQHVDVAVLEVGIGGKHDATSVVDPAAAAVTTVTLEHQDVLGDTIPEIARDKAHVAPDDAPLVTGTEGEALAAVREVAGDVLTVGEPDTGADASTSGETDAATEASDVTVSYGGREGLEGAVALAGDDWRVETKLPLLGAHQARNAGVAAALCRQVADVSESELVRGLRNAHWPGRFEVMDREPLVVLDSAHNPGGCATLAATLGEFDYDDLYLVVGAMTDTDHAGMAEALPRATGVYTCRPDLDRAETSAALASSFADHVGKVHQRENVPGAVDDALAAAGPDDCVLVTGSLFTVAEARRRWSRVEIPKRVPDLETARAILEDADVTEPGIRRMRAKGVHRVLETRVQPRQASYLKEEMLSIGGECAVSGLSEQDRELVDVVLTGTLQQCERLVGTLDGQPYGLDRLGEQLREALGIREEREALGIRVEREERGYPWADGTAVMGILNVTPDSFHDGGRYDAASDAVARAEEMVEAGAEIVDVGGESTRPGAEPVPVEDEIARVVPVIERIAEVDAMVSIDTRKAEVARAALDAGADLLNDVSGIEDPEMRLVAADYDVPVVVMHSVETPVEPPFDREWDDVVEDVIDELVERVLLAEKAGLDRSQILVDPGIGFGKGEHASFELLGRLNEFRALGCPVLVGHSHKSMFRLVGGDYPDCPSETVAATAVATMRGADVVRVHDVAANVAAVHTVEAARQPDDW